MIFENCILLEVLLVGIAVVLTFFFGIRLFNPRYPNRIATCGYIFFLLGIAGLFISIGLDLLVAMTNMVEGYAFSPIVWSPDGKHLAFGVVVDGFTSWTIVVMDANGDHRTTLIDLYEDDRFTDGHIEDIRWDTEGNHILFMATQQGSSLWGDIRYYTIAPDTKELQEITEELYLFLSAPHPTTTPTLETKCGERHIIEDSAIYDNQLVAQSVCHGREYGWTIPSHECYQNLEICEVATGKVLFVLDEYPNRNKDAVKTAEIAVLAMRVSFELTLIGLFISMSVGLYRLVRYLRNRKSTHR